MTLYAAPGSPAIVSDQPFDGAVEVTRYAGVEDGYDPQRDRWVLVGTELTIDLAYRRRQEIADLAREVRDATAQRAALVQVRAELTAPDDQAIADDLIAEASERLTHAAVRSGREEARP